MPEYTQTQLPGLETLDRPCEMCRKREATGWTHVEDTEAVEVATCDQCDAELGGDRGTTLGDQTSRAGR